jgi:acyl-CoA dehydrogenase
VIDGEKWFVTSGDEADYVIVHALVDGDPMQPTLFLVDRDAPGLTVKRTPKFTHTYV